MKFLDGIKISNILSSILKTDSSGNIAAAVANTDYAPIASPTFTGTTNTNNLRAGGVFSLPSLVVGAGNVPLLFNGLTGAISLAADGTDYVSPTTLTSDLIPYATLASPSFTGTVKIGTLSGILKASSGNISVATAGTDYLTPSGSGASLTGIPESAVTNLTTDLAAKAPLASPSFTGSVTIGTLAGLIKGTTGVLSVAAAGTDYLIPSGSGAALSGVALLAGSYANPTWITSLAATKLTGIVPIADLGTNTAAIGLYLRGDNLWAIDSVVAQNPCGRLTLVSGNPVTMADQAAIATLYYTPYNGNTISLWNTSLSVWETLTFTEQTLSLSGFTNGKIYDIWAQNNNNGTFTLTATIWTDLVTRATALVLQNGVYVKTGALGSRYLGSIYITATGQTSDTQSVRGVWNAYNRIPRKLLDFDSNTASYTIVGGTGLWQYCRATASTVQLFVLIGLPREPINVIACGYAFTPVNASYNTGVNFSNGTPAALAYMDSGYSFTSSGTLQTGSIQTYMHQPTTVGLHLFTQMEFAASGTITTFPRQGPTGWNQSAGLTGLTWG
jgi:hypothetical protein